MEVRHGHGAIVKAEDDWDRFDQDVLAALLGGPRAAEVLAEYLECRRILEVEAAGLAAERATPEALERLTRAYERMRLTAEGARDNPAGEQLYHDADVAFHRAVVRAAGNPVLGRMTEPIHRALAATFGALARPRMRFERGLPEHERILEAIRGAGTGDRARGDAGAPGHGRGLPARVRRERRRQRAPRPERLPCSARDRDGRLTGDVSQ